MSNFYSKLKGVENDLSHTQHQFTDHKTEAKNDLKALKKEFTDKNEEILKLTDNSEGLSESSKEPYFLDVFLGNDSGLKRRRISLRI